MLQEIQFRCQSIDVIRMKSYLDSLFDPACVSVRVTIDKLDED